MKHFRHAKTYIGPVFLFADPFSIAYIGLCHRLDAATI